MVEETERDVGSDKRWFFIHNRRSFGTLQEKTSSSFTIQTIITGREGVSTFVKYLRSCDGDARADSQSGVWKKMIFSLRKRLQFLGPRWDGPEVQTELINIDNAGIL